MNTNDSEFALAPDGFAKFQEYFGRPEHAYYIGLSKAQTDWPYLLPGPVDRWAGWDAMSTLPIGFVLKQVSSAGQCVFTIRICDTQPKYAPTSADHGQRRDF